MSIFHRYRAQEAHIGLRSLDKVLRAIGDIEHALCSTRMFGRQRVARYELWTAVRATRVVESRLSKLERALRATRPTKLQTKSSYDSEITVAGGTARAT